MEAPDEQGNISTDTQTILSRWKMIMLRYFPKTCLIHSLINNYNE